MMRGMPYRVGTNDLHEEMLWDFLDLALSLWASDPSMAWECGYSIWCDARRHRYDELESAADGLLSSL